MLLKKWGIRSLEVFSSYALYKSICTFHDNTSFCFVVLKMSLVINEFEGKYKFLSNSFTPNNYKGIRYKGKIYKTVQHAYRLLKLKNAKQLRKSFLLRNPSKPISKTEIDWWFDISSNILLDLVRIKFSDPELRDLLLETGDKLIRYTSDCGDGFYGIESIATIRQRACFGKILMLVRQELRKTLPDQSSIEISKREREFLYINNRYFFV